MANLQRQRRVADQIRRELSDIIRLELKDPRVGMITLTDVEMSPDLGYAKVFFTQMGDDEARTEAVRGLKRAGGFLRSMLGQRINIHVTPELQFVYDDSVERGVHLSHLIDEAVALNPVAQPPAPPPPPLAGVAIKTGGASKRSIGPAAKASMKKPRAPRKA